MSIKIFSWGTTGLRSTSKKDHHLRRNPWETAGKCFLMHSLSRSRLLCYRGAVSARAPQPTVVLVVSFPTFFISLSHIEGWKNIFNLIIIKQLRRVVLQRFSVCVAWFKLNRVAFLANYIRKYVSYVTESGKFGGFRGQRKDTLPPPSTGPGNNTCTWFCEIGYCCCLPLLPQLACNILATTYKYYFRAQYSASLILFGALQDYSKKKLVL